MWTWNPEQAAISAIFQVYEKPNFCKSGVPHVTKRATRATNKSWPVSAATFLWLILGSAAYSQPATPSPASPTGDWLVADRVARIKIVDCGGHLWGVVAWEARPGGTDIRNPDPQLRSRPTLGMPILLDMVPANPNKWEGQVYNSQNGKTYSANISLSDPNTLRIQGCVFGFLCAAKTGLASRRATPSAGRLRKLHRNLRRAAARPRRHRLHRPMTCAHESLAPRGFPISAG